jgi:hypothetical protein
MQDIAPIQTGPRTWQEVARDRGISLRILGELIGRPHSTMLAYSSHKRTTPQEILWKLARVLGEPVR